MVQWFSLEKLLGNLSNEIIKSPQNEKAVEYTSIYLDLFEKLDELLYGRIVGKMLLIFRI